MYCGGVTKHLIEKVCFKKKRDKERQRTQVNIQQLLGSNHLTQMMNTSSHYSIQLTIQYSTVI